MLVFFWSYFLNSQPSISSLQESQNSKPITINIAHSAISTPTHSSNLNAASYANSLHRRPSSTGSSGVDLRRRRSSRYGVGRTWSRESVKSIGRRQLEDAYTPMLNAFRGFLDEFIQVRNLLEDDYSFVKKAK